jgi:hypothetical protein
VPALFATFFCGGSLEEWQKHTGQDAHTRAVVNTDGRYSSDVWVAKAAEKMFAF